MPRYIDKVFNTEEPTLEFSTAFNDDLLKKLLGDQQEQKFDLAFTADCPIYVPARRHKKKRIQKKWIKRYGYRCAGYQLKKHSLSNVTPKVVNRSEDLCEIEFEIEGN